MADPGNPSEFSPAELDRLEDALALWTGDALATALPAPEDSSLPAPVRVRLGEYRDLLALSREALALEEVPAGLLDGVLAEAHASAAPLTTPSASSRAAAQPGLWERLRRSLLLPGVALAGSTALLLWLIQPPEDTTQLLAAHSTPGLSPAPARLTPGDGPAPAGPAPEALAAEPSASPPASPPAESTAAAADEAGLDLERIASKSDAAEARPGSKAELSKTRPSRHKDEVASPELLLGLDDTPTHDADKEALRDTLELADTQRRAGRCEAAMKLYEQAFTMSGPADERARARAGYGLCLSSLGEDGKADKYFDYATRTSPGILSWINMERGEGAYTKKSSRASKPSPARSKLPTAE